MFFYTSAEDQDVIEVHDDELVEEWLEDLIHGTHECSRSVGQAKREDSPLEVTVTSAKRGLVHILIFNADLVVARAKVNLGEDARAHETIDELFDARERILVLDGDLVQRTVIDSHEETAILLAREDDRCAEGALAWLDEALVEELRNLLLHLVHLSVRQTEGGTRGRL